MQLLVCWLSIASFVQEIRISKLENKIGNKFMELEHKNTKKNND